MFVAIAGEVRTYWLVGHSYGPRGRKDTSGSVDDELQPSLFGKNINSERMSSRRSPKLGVPRRGSFITFKNMDGGSSANLPAFVRLQGQASNVSLRTGSPKLGRKILKGLQYSRERLMENFHGQQSSVASHKEGRIPVRQRLIGGMPSRPSESSLCERDSSSNSSRNLIRTRGSTSDLEAMRGPNRLDDHTATLQPLLLSEHETEGAVLELKGVRGNSFVKRKLSVIPSAREDEAKDCEVALLGDECEEVFTGSGRQRRNGVLQIEPQETLRPVARDAIAGNRSQGSPPTKKWHSWGQIACSEPTAVVCPDAPAVGVLSHEARNNSVSLLDEAIPTTSTPERSSSFKQWISGFVGNGNLAAGSSDKDELLGDAPVVVTSAHTASDAKDGKDANAERKLCDEDTLLWQTVKDGDYGGAIESTV